MVIQRDIRAYDFGTPAHQLVRRDDPDTSWDAAYSIDSTKLEAMVYRAIRSFGPQGCISDEVRAQFPTSLSYSSVTARYKALMDSGAIFDIGLRRRGTSGRMMRVMVASIYKIGAQGALPL